jgi:hypothetical protein
MALTNPTNLVDVQCLERFKQQTDQLYASQSQVAASYATKNELSQATIIPVDLDSMTPSTTFVKNNILFINGVGYRAKKDTTHFPVVLVVQNNQFVVDIVDGAPAYVVSDYTLDEDWEVWGDAGIPRTLDQMRTDLDESIEQMEGDQAAFISEATTIVRGSVKLSDLVANTAGTRSYTVQQVLRAVADLMESTIVVNVENE